MITDILNKNLKSRPYYLEQIIGWINKPLVKVIVGARRVGKSTLLAQIIQYLVKEKGYDKDCIFYMNKEFPIYDSVKTYEDLTKLILDFIKDKEKIVIAIDEIQEIEHWEKTINGILSQYGEKVDIYITGSNAHLLSGEYATYLTGRYITISVYPLTYDEYCEFNGKKPSKENFLEFIEMGGLPGASLLNNSKDFIFQYLSSVYTTIIEKDIEIRNKINKKVFFQNLYKYVFSNIGSIFSAKNITDYLKSQKISISVDTVLDYLSYGEEAFLINKISSQDVVSKKIFSIYNKYYVGDLGIRNSLVGFDYQRDIGWLLENYVFLVLKKYGFNVYIGRFKDGKEIDFIAEKQGKIRYFQVTKSLLNTSTAEREYAPLIAIKDNWPKFIVSFDEFDAGESEGIKNINILDFEEILKGLI